jgi:hypothetical protein
MWPFRKKTIDDMPELFRDVCVLLENEESTIEVSDHLMRVNGIRIWLRNRPYADMDVSGILPPRWVAKIMRPYVERAIIRHYSKRKI